MSWIVMSPQKLAHWSEMTRMKKYAPSIRHVPISSFLYKTIICAKYVSLSFQLVFLSPPNLCYFLWPRMWSNLQWHFISNASSVSSCLSFRNVPDQFFKVDLVPDKWPKKKWVGWCRFYYVTNKATYKNTLEKCTTTHKNIYTVLMSVRSWQVIKSKEWSAKWKPKVSYIICSRGSYVGLYL